MNFAVIGGDLRLIKLAQMLSEDDNEVNVFAMEKSEEIKENKRIKKYKSLKETINNSKIVIASIPFIKKDGNMYTVFSEENLNVDNFLTGEYEEKIFIAGNITEKAREKLELKYKKVIDIMEQEELIILNTIATAEGAIDVAIRNTDIVVNESKVLILGFGRVGKVVANKFKALNAKVTCAARRKADLAWMEALGYKAVNINYLKENLKNYDIIINTVPKIIIEKNEMQYMKPSVLLIDLASIPGGINIDDADKMNLKCIWALALPRNCRSKNICTLYKKNYI